VSEVASTSVVPRRPGRAKLAAFVELGKLRIFELWLGVPLAWSLLTPTQRGEATTWVVLVLAVVVEMGTTSSALALDDVAGFRDGVDAANHQDTDRYGVNKPLLDGRLMEQDALRFAWSAVVIALFGLACAIAIAPHLPWWEPVMTLATIALALNYSYGVRLSYIGGCEAVTLLTLVATVIFPFGLLHGGVTDPAAVCAALVGLWMLQISLFSNTQDADGDREAGRLTLAARVKLVSNLRVIAATFAFSGALTAVALVTRVLPPIATALLVPCWVWQLRQLRAGLSDGNWLCARELGFQVFRLGVGALFLANLLAS
jgi:1,4-dihydroxy-2-naphthoate octaprenyltransferase